MQCESVPDVRTRGLGREVFTRNIESVSELRVVERFRRMSSSGEFREVLQRPGIVMHGCNRATLAPTPFAVQDPCDRAECQHGAKKIEEDEYQRRTRGNRAPEWLGRHDEDQKSRKLPRRPTQVMKAGPQRHNLLIAAPRRSKRTPWRGAASNASCNRN